MAGAATTSSNDASRPGNVLIPFYPPAYTYDVLGRVTLDDVTAFGAGVDDRVTHITTLYTALGQPSVMDSLDASSSSINQVSWTYNGFGEQATQTTQSHLTGGIGTVSFGYSFNPAAGGANHNRLSSITYPSGKVVTYDYGTAGSLNDKIGRVDALKEGATTLEQYSYLGLDTIVERNRPQPGVNLTYISQGTGDELTDGGDPYTGFDRFGRVIDQRWRKTTGTPTDIDRVQYAYDKSSNRTSKDVLGSGNPGNLDEAYFYDNLNRLTKVNRGSLASGTISDAAATFAQTWTLDALGNWTTFVNDSNGGAAGGQTTQNRTHNRRNQITNIGVGHDANGNVTQDDLGHSFTYDAWDRLVTSGGVRYTYDGRGYRTERIQGPASVYYHYTEGQQLIEERLIDPGPGATIATYVWGLGYVDQMVLRDHILHGRQYAQQDANYNVTSITDSSGTAQERYVYTPYGTVSFRTGTWGTRSNSLYDWQYLHQGLRQDPATTLYDSRGRWYSATMGRFTSNDRIGYGDGMNLYQYEISNPVRFTDSSGLNVDPDWGIDIDLIDADLSTGDYSRQEIEAIAAALMVEARRRKDWHWDVWHNRWGKQDPCGRPSDYHKEAYNYWWGEEQKYKNMAGLALPGNPLGMVGGARPDPSQIRQLKNLDPAKDLLNDAQKQALLDNAKAAVKGPFPELCRRGRQESITRFLSNDFRWKFLNQVPEAQSLIRKFLQDNGIPIPPGI